MGNESSKSSKNENDNENCDWEKIGNGCGESINGSNENEIKRCKILCLDDLIETLEERKSKLKKNVKELKIKFNRLKNATLPSAKSGINSI
tara:strand:+ start:482 stop:754 length:273 start_codon:yes stop_codon:yes gene_type:complete